jgi:hypothetical protein
MRAARLTAKIADVAHRNADFFLDLAHDTFFYGLPRFHKAG